MKLLGKVLRLYDRVMTDIDETHRFFFWAFIILGTFCAPFAVLAWNDPAHNVEGYIILPVLSATFFGLAVLLFCGGKFASGHWSVKRYTDSASELLRRARETY